MRNKWICALVVAIVAVALTGPTALVNAKEKKLLLDGGGNNLCSGATVGKVIQRPGFTFVKVKIVGGQANATRQVFEVCQSGAGCHAGCGFQTLGTITTDGTGFAKKKFTRKLNDPVHYDVCVGSASGCSGPSYWAGNYTLPTGASGGAAVSGGDPSSP